MVAYTLTQPVRDAKADFKKCFPGAPYLGDVGDLRHLKGTGDHTPWAGDVIWGVHMKSGYIYAVDLGNGGDFNCVKFMMWLLAQLKRNRYPQVKYIISNFEMYDRRYRWRAQRGGDDAGHIHISFMPGYEDASFSAIRDYRQALDNAANVVKEGTANLTPVDTDPTGEHVEITVIDGWSIAFVRGQDDYLHYRLLDENGAVKHNKVTGKPYGWTRVLLKLASGPSVCSTTGRGGLAVAFRRSDGACGWATVDDILANPAKQVWTVTNLGGVLTSAPDIRRTNDGYLVIVRGKGPNFGVFTKTWTSGNRQWSPWQSLGKVAK